MRWRAQKRRATGQRPGRLGLRQSIDDSARVEHVTVRLDRRAARRHASACIEPPPVGGKRIAVERKIKRDWRIRGVGLAAP
jgi:hypothetical protein